MTDTTVKVPITPPVYLQYTFPNIIRIDRYTFKTVSVGTLPLSWRLEGSLDGGTTWSNLEKTPPDRPLSIEAERNYTCSIPPINVSAVRLNVLQSDGDHVQIENFRVLTQPGVFTKYIVPFCTDMSSQYHTGSLNGAQVDSMQLKLSRPVPATFYGVSHNILRFENGMASLGW
jgi:hypothetical protein